MPQGIEIYDELGRVVLNTTTRLGTIIGYRVINSFGSGSITVPSSAGEVFTVIQSMVDIPTNVASVTISGNVINWVYQSNPKMTAMNPHVLFYGVY